MTLLRMYPLYHWAGLTVFHLTPFPMLRIVSSETPNFLARRLRTPWVPYLMPTLLRWRLSTIRMALMKATSETVRIGFIGDRGCRSYTNLVFFPDSLFVAFEPVDLLEF